MNLNELAVEITVREGKKKATNIAQVKEVLHVLGGIFAELSWFERLSLVNKIRKAGKN